MQSDSLAHGSTMPRDYQKTLSDLYDSINTRADADTRDELLRFVSTMASLAFDHERLSRRAERLERHLSDLAALTGHLMLAREIRNAN
jgi:predicted ATP-grasp superfamily ATP-dependent carboligase